MSWEPIDWAALGERPPVTPTLGGLVYPGRRHVFSGPPESGKTWAAFALAVEELRQGGIVLHADFEMFAHETRDRLRAMGVTAAELERFLHVEPETAATADLIGELIERWRPTLAIVDAAAGAYGLQGLDDNGRKDVETFARTVIEPMRLREVASILVDHVTKSAETRGAFAIGSERKIGGADVHLGFQVVEPLARGRSGLVRITVHKDRFGHLPRPVAAELEIRSDPETHVIVWAFRQPCSEEMERVEWRPTRLMEKVSRSLEGRRDPVSMNGIEKAKLGKAEYVRQAVDALVAGGYVSETKGAGRARLFASLRPFREHDDSANGTHGFHSEDPIEDELKRMRAKRQGAS